MKLSKAQQTIVNLLKANPSHKIIQVFNARGQSFVYIISDDGIQQSDKISNTTFNLMLKAGIIELAIHNRYKLAEEKIEIHSETIKGNAGKIEFKKKEANPLDARRLACLTTLDEVKAWINKADMVEATFILGELRCLVDALDDLNKPKLS